MGGEEGEGEDGGACLDGDGSAASQTQPKYRTGKKSKYRRFGLFYSSNIGGFKENFRRFINFDG